VDRLVRNRLAGAVLVLLVAATVTYVCDGIFTRFTFAHRSREITDLTDRVVETNRKLRAGEYADPKASEQKLAEMRELHAELLVAAEEAGRPSRPAAALSMTAGFSIVLVWILLFDRRSRMRTQAAARMDSARAAAVDLADPGAFRLEESRLVLTRELSPDRFDDLQDLRLALGKLLAEPGETLVFDGAKITLVSSQMLGALAEVAVQLKAKGRKLRVVASEKLAEMIGVMGLEKLVDVEVKGTAKE
jgi:anti-anti-sigma regulatory factor